ncbi:RHS repeat-associated core domain-containing protein, partial [Actinomadura sp. KC06]|uniref:RHS repeat-associated core domain-containing protein n=1 Tax=Actinomadura sp. KC06 TaxID=2530369 RepID=UPI001046C0AF
PHRNGPPPLHPHDGGAMSRYTERYEYDPVGNLLQIVHAVADSATPGWTRTYRYDQESLLEPGVMGNRLGAVDGVRLDHDPQGNATALPGLAFLSWDAEDRLHVTAHRPPSGETPPEATWSSYDSAGTRVRKVTDRPGPDGERIRVRERLYLGPFEVFREYAPDGEVTLERTTLHVLDEDRRVALIEKRTRGDDKGPELLVRHQLDDHLGSPTLELDQQGRVLTQEEFHPYGSTAYETVSKGARAAPKRYRFTGRERDKESGLQYHGARFYAPWLARWTSPDPAGTKDSPSPYVYVAANPVRLTDPSGHEGVEPRQLNLAETLKQEVVATRTGRGISQALRRDLQAMWEWWGGHGKVDAGHVGKAQWELRAGERGLVAAQPFAENRSLGVLERVRAGAARLAGKFARNAEGVDEGVSAGKRFGRAVRAAWRDDAAFKAFLKSWKPGAAGTAATAAAETGGAAAAQAGALAESSAQLSLSFEAAEAGGARVATEVESALAASQAGTKVRVADSVVEAAKTAAPAAEEVGEVASAVSKGGRVLRAAAPALRVVGKVAGPLAVAASVHQIATAQTTAEKADASVGVSSAVLGLSANPVTGIAAGGLVAGGYVGGKVEGAVTEATGSREAGVAAGTLAGAATGAAIGAVVGSIVPGVGTAVGAAVGATAGAVGGFIKSYWK